MMESSRKDIDLQVSWDAGVVQRIQRPGEALQVTGGAAIEMERGGLGECVRVHEGSEVQSGSRSHCKPS